MDQKDIQVAVKHQIFVSSTFNHLKDERRIVIESIMGMQSIPAGMELFEAGNDDQWTYIKRRIDESDYYIVTVAQRYGAIGPGGKSYTRMEYEYALSQGIPVAAFLLSEEARASWPANKTEYEAASQIEEFRTLCKQKLVRYWNTGPDLGGAVLTAILGLQREHPRPGWVRGDTVASEFALKEIARLSEERRNLQTELAQIRESSQGLRMPPDVRFRIERLHRMKVFQLVSFQNGEPEGLQPDLEYSVLNSFIDGSRELAKFVRVWEASDALIKRVYGHSLGDLRKRVHASPVFDELASQNLVDVTFRDEYPIFAGLAGVPERPQSVRYLSLSEYGKTFLLHAERWLDEEEPQAQS